MAGWLPLGISTGWNDLKLGNGGLIERISLANDGTIVCCTDSFGGYIWDASKDKWQQLLTTTAMPSSAMTALLDGTTGAVASGFDDLIVDPSNSNNIWMVYYGNIYKSTNKGVSFNTTGFTAISPLTRSMSGPAKGMAPYSAIDPNNSSVGYFSTSGWGMFRTTNGGTSFAAIPEVFAGMPTYSGTNPATITKLGTATDSQSITLGSKTFTIGNPFGSGYIVKVWRTSDPTKQLFGTVTSSTGTAFTINVTSIQGSGGPFTDWSVSNFQTDQSQNAGYTCGGHRIVFDTSAGTIAGVGGLTVTKNVYIHTYGVNTYFSGDGGLTWSAVTQTNMPNVIQQMRVDSAGTLWAIDGIFNYAAGGVANTTTLNKYSGGATGAWTNNVAAPAGTGAGYWYSSVAVDPLNAGVIVAAGSSTMPLNTVKSTDGGATWNYSAGTTTFVNSASNDVAWFTNYLTANPTWFFGCTVAQFDTVTSGKMWIGSEGVWYTTPPASASPLTLAQQTRGIEEFIAIRIVSPGSGGSVFMGTWDFPLFYSNNFSSYPTTLTGQPGNNQGLRTSLIRGYSVDWLWNNPSTAVNLVQGRDGFTADVYSGISTTGGATPAAWTTFSGKNDINIGSDIVISSATTYVYVPVSSNSTGQKPKISTDSGLTWNDIAALPANSWGSLTSDIGGSGVCKTADSDKANGDIYIYNININNGGSQGIYRMAAGSNTWTLQASGSLFTAPNSNINEQLKCPGVAGHVWFTSGQQGASFPANVPFYWSIDQGANWTSVSNFKQVITYGFGAIASGQTYPTIFAAGWYNGTATTDYGIWMCKNFNPATGAGTWTRIGEQFPRGIMDFPKDIDGDKVTPGKVYVFHNGGAFWGQFA